MPLTRLQYLLWILTCALPHHLCLATKLRHVQAMLLGPYRWVDLQKMDHLSPQKMELTLEMHSFSHPKYPGGLNCSSVFENVPKPLNSQKLELTLSCTSDHLITLQVIQHGNFSMEIHHFGCQTSIFECSTWGLKMWRLNGGLILFLFWFCFCFFIDKKKINGGLIWIP